MDLDNDGHKDMLTGSWPGELFWFRGKGSGEFEKSVMLKDAEGNFICIGGGIEETDDGIMITGNAEFKETDDGDHYVVYHGKKIDSTMDKQVSVTGTASVVHAVDWDNDGDLDLLVGDIGGHVYLVQNQGSFTEFKFVEHQKIGCGDPEQTIRVEGGDAGPVAADWDGDGDLDLIVGCGNGSVRLYRNQGTRSEPKLAKAEELISKGEVKYSGNAPRTPTRGQRAKVCVTDYNDDGLLDILLGDYAVLGHDPPELSEEEQKEHALLEEERNSLNKKYRELIKVFMGPDRTKDKDEAKAAGEEIKELTNRLTEITEILPKETTSHGWVWGFLQIPVKEDSAGAGSLIQ